MALKETFFFDMNIFLHEKDKFLYYREDDMPDMVRIDNSLLHHGVLPHKNYITHITNN